MGRITELDVSEMNDRIGQATTGFAAFQIVGQLTPTMTNRLLDLNGIDPDSLFGTGLSARREMVATAHGWSWSDRDDKVPADGFGPCADGFSPHSRRPWECRHCKRRTIDHRPVR